MREQLLFKPGVQKHRRTARPKSLRAQSKRLRARPRGFCTNQQPSQCGMRSPTLFGLDRNGCWHFRGSQLPQVLPSIFSPCCPLNNRRRAAPSFCKIGRLCSLFSCLSPARLHLLIFLFLLMSGNFHLNPGLIFPYSVCVGNVIWRGRSVQCCT